MRTILEFYMFRLLIYTILCYITLYVLFVDISKILYYNTFMCIIEFYMFRLLIYKKVLYYIKYSIILIDMRACGGYDKSILCASGFIFFRKKC